MIVQMKEPTRHWPPNFSDAVGINLMISSSSKYWSKILQKQPFVIYLDPQKGKGVSELINTLQSLWMWMDHRWCFWVSLKLKLTILIDVQKMKGFVGHLITRFPDCIPSKQLFKWLNIRIVPQSITLILFVSNCGQYLEFLLIKHTSTLLSDSHRSHYFTQPY